jgi:hypothetical protein
MAFGVAGAFFLGSEPWKGLLHFSPAPQCAHFGSPRAISPPHFGHLKPVSMSFSLPFLLMPDAASRLEADGPEAQVDIALVGR